MRVLIAAAIFGISFGIYGCSNEANVAGRPMAAAGAPAASPGAAIQTTADANASIKTPAAVNPPAVGVNPPAVVSSTWVEITTPGSTTLTVMDMRTNLKWSNRRPNATWQVAINHCSALNYNGVTGWRLPTREELLAAPTNGIYAAAKEGWMTANDVNAYFWSSSSVADNPNYAWHVYLALGGAYPNRKFSSLAVVCVQ